MIYTWYHKLGEEHRKQVAKDLFYPRHTCLRTRKSKHNNYPHSTLKSILCHLISAKISERFSQKMLFSHFSDAKTEEHRTKGDRYVSLICRCLSVPRKCVPWLKRP